MSFCDFNQSTSAIGFGGAGDNRERVWVVPPKHCGGMTECGIACHKGINCTVVDSFQKDGKTVYKYYCRECKEFGEGSPQDGCK